jgi:surfeit locus 1 family protein
VNRGWVPAAPTRDVLPPVRTPATPVRIEGVKRERLPRVLVSGASSGTVRQTLDIAGFARETGLQLQPFFLEQHSDSGDGLSRDWAAPDAAIEKHASYSLQWYSLAALAAVLGLLFSFRRVAAP